MSKGLLNSMVLKNLFEDVHGEELLPSLIESGVISKEQVEEYYKTNIKGQKEQKPVYSIIEDGVLVKFDKRDLDKNGGYVTPIGIHTIKEYSFSSCDNLTKITIRRDVAEIGESAFESCCNLKSVKMANGVCRLGEHVFDSCISLTDVKLSSKLKFIPAYTFMNCINLQQIMLPEKLEVIQECAFGYCENLNIISNPTESLMHVDELAFDGTPIGRDFMVVYYKNKGELNQAKGDTK